MSFKQFLEVMKTEKMVWRVLFQTFGPLGCICRLFGQLPFTGQQTEETLQLKFNLFSLSSLYTILCNIGFVLLFGYYKYFDFRDGGFLLLPSITLKGWLGLSFVLIFLNYWFDMLGLLREIETFDQEVEKLSVVFKLKQSYSKNFWYTLPPILLIIWPILLHSKIDSALGTIFILKPLVYNVMTVSSVLYLWFGGEIIHRTHKLQTSWLKYLKLATKYNYKQPVLQHDLYHRLNVKLNDCVSLLNNGFAFKVAVICADFFFTSLIEGYYTNKTTATVFRLSRKVWNTIFVVSIGVTAIKLESANQIVLENIFDVPVSTLNPCLRHQLDLIVMRLHRSQVELQCPGLIRYSKDFIGTFTLTLVTYFILVTQLAATG